MCQYFQRCCGNLFLLLEKQGHFFRTIAENCLSRHCKGLQKYLLSKVKYRAPWIWQNESCETRLLLHAMHAKIDMEKASFQCIACS